MMTAGRPTLAALCLGLGLTLAAGCDAENGDKASAGDAAFRG